MRGIAVAAAYQDDVRTEPLSCWRNNLLKGSSYSTVTGIPCICSSVRPDVGNKQTSTRNPASEMLLVMQLTNSNVYPLIFNTFCPAMWPTLQKIKWDHVQTLQLCKSRPIPSAWPVIILVSIVNAAAGWRGVQQSSTW